MTSPTPERRQLVILEHKAKVKALDGIIRRLTSERDHHRAILSEIYGVGA